MSQADQQAILNVHFEGAIAYAPDNGTLWALVPNTLAPVSARWPTMEGILSARGSHIPFMIVDEDLVDKGKTYGLIDAFFQKGDYAALSTRPSAKAAIALLGEGLDFHLDGNKVNIAPEVYEYVPRMSVISSKHKYVSRNFHPEDPNFYERGRHGLSAALQLRTGDLLVSRFYGDANPYKVDFGYVHSWFGNPKYRSRVWKCKVANRLTWTVKLPAQIVDTLTCTCTVWETGEPYEYTFKIPENRVLNIEIMNSEVEIPALFQDDPILPERTQRLPDPDFEALYGLSSQTSKWYSWRVPVPRGDGAGLLEKPCTGGYFEGFR